jgi:hypothetical protein
MACTKVLSGRDARQVTALLCLPEIADLDETRWTGRPGYPFASWSALRS